MVILERETARLMDLSIAEKLGATHAKDLRDYIYLLQDLRKHMKAQMAERKQARKAGAAAVTTEQLEQALGIKLDKSE